MEWVVCGGKVIDYYGELKFFECYFFYILDMMCVYIIEL